MVKHVIIDANKDCSTSYQQDNKLENPTTNNHKKQSLTSLIRTLADRLTRRRRQHNVLN